MLYTVQDTTMTALGDAVRNKVLGTTELPISTISEQYISYDKAYSFVFPTYVKKIKIVGTGRYTMVWEGNGNGYQGVGIAPGVYTSEHNTRNAEGYTIVYTFDMDTIYNEKYFDFEAMVEGNSFTLVASKASSSSTSYYLTYTAIGLDENGNEFKYTPAEMVENINNLMTIPDEALTITGNCERRFNGGGWDWFIKNCGDKITTNKISNITYMFGYCYNLEEIPFDINMVSSDASAGYTFLDCNKLRNVPMINNFKMSSSGSPQMFSGCNSIRNFPVGFADDWDFSQMKQSTYGGMNSCFSSCYSLREVPKAIIANCCNKNTSSYSTGYYSLFSGCYSLDEINGLEVAEATLTSNCFNSTFNINSRLKNMTFSVNEDGTPKTAKWKSQTIDLTNAGYLYTNYLESTILNYNSGITLDKKVTDDVTYASLKDDPDYYTLNINYSRYNHDSAVNTINSLPDTSAYGTNTIKFKGSAGALTDGGAINTLTEAEIAVASAKGWTVSFV